MKLGKIFAALTAAALALSLCACQSKEEREFAALREKAESKSGIVYRTTYFLDNDDMTAFPYPVQNDEGKYAFSVKDENGDETSLTDFVFDDARQSYSVDGENQFIAPAEKDGKWGYALLDISSPSGAEITWAIEPKYENAEVFTEQVAAVKQDGLYGVINENGEFTIAPYYDAIKYRSFTYMPAEKDGVWYFIDGDGKRIFGPFEDAESFEYGYAAVKKDGKWGFINKNGLDATAFVYDEAYSVENDFKAWVRTGDKWEKVAINE